MARGQKGRQYVLPPPERMVTRNRGKRQTVVPASLEKKTNGSTRKRNNTKKSWEGSDEELDYASDLFSPSEDEVFYDEEYVDEDQSDNGDETEVAEQFLLDDEDTISCPWAENEPYEPLILPNGSRDLFFPSGTLMDLIQIYEIVVNYHRIIQVSPFIFEDFVAAMRSPEQTQLVADIHIALLRCIIRDDDEAQISYAVTETSVSFQLIFNLMDATTYGEVLRQYIESDSRFPSGILAIVSKNYPFVPVEDKIKVLLWLCSQFFETTAFSKVIRSDGKLPHNEHCRECGKMGNELIPCSGCDAVYHRHCNSEAVKGSNWLCSICEVHYASDTANCLPFNENIRKPALRRTPIGYDREGRIYWFLVRRIVVEDIKNNSVQFYSTLPAIYDLVSHLDPYRYEVKLCKKIYKLLDTIERQCRATQELSRKRLNESPDGNLNKECYLDLENYYRMSYITWTVVSSKTTYPAFDEKTDVPVEEIPLRLKSKFLKLLGFEGNELIGRDWTGGRGMEELLMYRERFVINLGLDEAVSFIPMNDMFREDVRDCFRLGLNDQVYKSYENLYEKNEYAKSPIQRGKERERKKYMSTRFSIDEPFQWKVSKGRSILDVEQLVLKFLKISLRHVVEKIPDELFHRDWRTRKLQILEHLTLTGRHMEATEIAKILLQIEAALRKPTFTNAWWSSLGHTRLYRYSSTEKDAKIAFEKQRAQDERDLIAADSSDENIVQVKATKVKSIPKVLSRMKGEAYRVVGYGDYGGWEWVSIFHKLDYIVPEKPPLGISYSSCGNELITVAAKKAYKLDKIIKKLTCWRESQIEELNTFKKSRMKCFSPSCGKTTSNICGKMTKCYSIFCPLRMKQPIVENSDDTSGVVKAFDPVRRRMFLYEQENKDFENTEGLGKSFPFPKPFNYLHKKSGKPSILVLPKSSARKMARTGGLTQVVIPGFNANAKTNTLVWNYPCARPLFDNCWRFNTVNATTIHALALQLRIFYCGIRWYDLEQNWYDDNDYRFLTTHPDYNELRTVISHKEFPPDGYYERYKLKVELFAEDDDGLPPEIAGDVVIKKETSVVSENTPKSIKPTRKSDRRRSKKNNASFQLRTDTQRKTVERWIDGVELKLFEIVHYWKNYNEKLAPLKSIVVSQQKQNMVNKVGNQSKPAILPMRKRPSPDYYDEQPAVKTVVVRKPPERQIEYGYSYAEIQRPRVVLPQFGSYGYQSYQPRIVHVNRPSNMYANNGKRVVYVLRTPDGRSISQVQSSQYAPLITNGIRIQKRISDNPPVLTPMVSRPSIVRVPIRPQIRQMPKENGIMDQEQSDVKSQYKSENGEF